MAASNYPPSEKSLNLTFRQVKERKWLHKIQCFFFSHWWTECPDGNNNKFCSRGCGK